MAYSFTRTASLMTLGTASAFWGHVTYPALILGSAAVQRRRGRAVAALSSLAIDESEASRVEYTVVIPAYLEAGEIGEAVSRWQYNGATEVLVAVDADPQTEAAARAAGATVSASDSRAGKVGALNRVISQVKTPVALLTDANTRISREHALRMVSHVASGRADVVGGVKVEDAESESRYWQFENALKEAEESLGGCPVLVGEAIVLRPQDWENIPDWVRVDDLYLSARYAERGLKVRVDTSCLAIEPSAEADEQHVRRVRMASGVMELMLHAPATMLGADPARLMILGHKVCRLTAGPAAQLGLSVASLRLLPRWLALPAVIVQWGPILDYWHHVRSERLMDGKRGFLAQTIGMAPVVWFDSLRRVTTQGRTSNGTWQKAAR